MLTSMKRCGPPRMRTRLCLLGTLGIAVAVPTVFLDALSARAPESPPVVPVDGETGKDNRQPAVAKVERALPEQDRSRRDGTTALNLSLPSGSGTTLDLINLANSYAETAGRLREAEARLELLQQTNRKAAEAITQSELDNARNKVSTLQAKDALLRKIVRVAHQGAVKRREMLNEQVKLLEAMHRAGRTQVRPDQVLEVKQRQAEAETAVHILKAILESVDDQQPEDGEKSGEESGNQQN